MAQVVVATFATLTEAQIVAGALGSGGLHAVVADQHYGSVVCFEQRALQGFRVTVPQAEAADAKAYLADRNYQDKLKAALEQHLGSGVTVRVAVGETSGASAAAIENREHEARRAEAARAVRSDGFVQDLVDLFDGKVVDSTIGSKERGTRK